MTILIEGDKSFIISAQAHLISNEREVASNWASKHIKPNPAIKWILGNYVEADKANYNKQFWTYDDLRMAQPTVEHAPLNILHRPKHIVGAFTATEMIYPNNEAAADATSDSPMVGSNPYIEALAAFWTAYFPDELAIVEMAHNQGSLFFSMECVSDTITCAGDNGCGQEFAFKGPKSDTYCAHLNENASIKQLNKPLFLAGALIFPPASPGWGGASINEISNLLAKYEEQVPAIYEAIKAEADHLTELQVEEVVVEHLASVDQVTAGYGKRQMQKKGKQLAKQYLDKKKNQDMAGKKKPASKATCEVEAEPASVTEDAAAKEDRVTSFRASKWQTFDRGFAEMIRSEHPDIWAKGGNIKGNDQYEILSKILKNGGSAKTEDQIAALELREAWIARHKGDFRLAGVIAQIKWLAVGTRGQDYMKNLVRDAIKAKQK